MKQLADAEIIVIGGGAVGCAVAYNLARAGQTDVLVVEREPTLAAATTAQAAGLVGQVRSTVERVKLAMWSVETFADLQQHGTAKPSWRQVGSLRVALTDARVDEFHQLRQVADRAGLEVQLIDRHTAESHWPMMNFRQAKAILWCPSDGYLQPSDLTMAYVAACRKRGVRFATGTRVTDVLVSRGRVTGIATNQGTVECQTLVNAAGAHAYHVAQSAGLELPIVPVRHEYFVTVRTANLGPAQPVVRLPDRTLYLRGEVGALLVGGWEPNAQSADPRRFALGDGPPPIAEDWDVLAEFGSLLAPQLPCVGELGIRSVFKGWPTFTPDGRFLVGESRRVRGFVMAGGCNAHGVSGSAGLGQHVVESILEKNPSPYVKSLNPDRFTETAWDWRGARRAAQHVYETYYALETSC